MKNCLAGGFLLVILASGCGDGRPTRVPIAGQVLIDNKPLNYGSIRFVPVHGRASTGKLDENGRFQLACFESEDGAIIGMHQVEVAACQSLGPTKSRWHAPKKYASFHTSGITTEIAEPTDSLVINLTWDGGAPFDEKTDSDEGGPRRRKSARK